MIRNYNYAAFLPEAVDSALGQTFRDFEVVVVDDGSTDDLVDNLRTYGDAIRVITQPNGGESAAANTGLAAARGVG